MKGVPMKSYCFVPVIRETRDGGSGLAGDKDTRLDKARTRIL